MAATDDPKPRRRRYRWVVVSGLLALGALLGVEGFLLEPRRVEPVEVTLRSTGLEREAVRLLLFSDVDFRGVGSRERRVRELANRFRPDLVVVAGDLIDRRSGTADPELIREAGAFLASLPAAHRLVVPGEEESEAVDRLREAWAPYGVDLLSAEGRRLRVRGESIDLFGANTLTDGVPWPLGREGGRPYVFSREGSRVALHRLVYRGDGAAAWGAFEATFAFQAVTPKAFLEFDAGWRAGGEPEGGTGWQICRDDGRDDFTVYAHWPGRKAIRGRRDSGFAPPTGRWCRARIRWDRGTEGPRLRARFWEETAREPADWAIDVFDAVPGPARTGSVGFAGRLGVRRYADLRVSALDGTILLEEPFDDPERIGDAWIGGSALQAWQREVGGSRGCRIVLAHHPEVALYLQDLVPPDVDVVLAGHTHGGQVRIPGLGPLYSATALGRTFDRGLFRVAGTPLYITAGVGTSLLPVRLFDPPEVTLLTIVPAR